MTTQTKQSREFAAALKAARIGAPEAQYEVGLMYANGLGTAQDFSQAIAWISKAAQRGLPAAQYLLATRYAGGVYVPRDDRAALTWYLRASEQGHLKAKYKLGQMLASAQPQASLSYINEAAQAGVPEAQYDLGLACETGQGQSQDLHAAALWFERSALQGYAPAQYAYASFCMQGRGVTPMPQEAVRWYRCAAAQDYPPAQVALELIDQADLPLRDGSSGRGRRRGNTKERRKGSERWLKVAAGGDADAAYHVALMHESGLGVTQDLDIAKELYLVAAEQFDPRAQLALAKILESESDFEKALAWYERAALQGNQEAEFALGRLHSGHSGGGGDALTGLAWYARAAVRESPAALWNLGKLLSDDVKHLTAACFAGAAGAGMAEAQFRLGECYSLGLGLQADAQRAVQQWLLAAQQGHVQAAYGLGLAYRQGNGVPANLVQAVYWFEKAAAAGDAKAQWNLGGILISGGEGVSPDLKRAFQYCQQAADQGFAPGQAALGLLYSRMGKPALAERWLRKAAQQRDPEACYNLAMLLRNTQGAAKHSELILKCLTDASEQGLPQAQLKLGLMFATGDGVVPDPIEAHKWLLISQANGHLLAKPNVEHSLTLLTAEQASEGARRADYWLSHFKFLDVKNG
jgi:uncharacterized protein